MWCAVAECSVVRWAGQQRKVTWTSLTRAARHRTPKARQGGRRGRSGHERYKEHTHVVVESCSVPASSKVKDEVTTGLVVGGTWCFMVSGVG